jgi:hypothetical protein
MTCSAYSRGEGWVSRHLAEHGGKNAPLERVAEDAAKSRIQSRRSE